jgi:acetyl esterase/lipase
MIVRSDVVYATRDSRDMHVDIYHPSGGLDYRTAVLVHHGGAWKFGDRKMMQPRCEVLARQGFTVLAVEYRLVTEAPWPAQLSDVKAAIRWTEQNAGQLGIEADRVVLQGHSAGAHLSLIAAGTHLRPDRDPLLEAEPAAGPIAAVVAYYPPVELDPAMVMPDLSAGSNPATRAAIRGANGSFPAAMLLDDSVTAQAAADASPITYATAGFPPTILFHGTDDGLIAPAGAVRFSDALRVAEVPCELHLVAGVNHEFDETPALTEVCALTVASFLYRYVIDPAAFRAEELRTNPVAAMLQPNARPDVGVEAR